MSALLVEFKNLLFECSESTETDEAPVSTELVPAFTALNIKPTFPNTKKILNEQETDLSFDFDISSINSTNIVRLFLVSLHFCGRKLN